MRWQYRGEGRQAVGRQAVLRATTSNGIACRRWGGSGRGGDGGRGCGRSKDRDARCRGRGVRGACLGGSRRVAVIGGGTAGDSGRRGKEARRGSGAVCGDEERRCVGMGRGAASPAERVQLGPEILGGHNLATLLSDTGGGGAEAEKYRRGGANVEQHRGGATTSPRS